MTASNLQALWALQGSPQTIFHLAGGASVGTALANPNEDYSRTVASTAALLEWLRQVSPATRLVAVSSAAVYGAGHSGPIAETALGKPYSPYGYHKFMMEQLCNSYGASYGIGAVIMRLFSVYGAGLKKQLLWDICSKLGASASEIELGGTGGELRDWVDVRDAVGALSVGAALATAAIPVVNVGSGVAVPVSEIAASCVAAWGGAGQRARVRFNGSARPGDPFSLQADIHRLAACGIHCRIPVAQGIPEYVRWFQSEAAATP